MNANQFDALLAMDLPLQYCRLILILHDIGRPAYRFEFMPDSCPTEKRHFERVIEKNPDIFKSKKGDSIPQEGVGRPFKLTVELTVYGKRLAKELLSI